MSGGPKRNDPRRIPFESWLISKAQWNSAEEVCVAGYYEGTIRLCIFVTMVFHDTRRVGACSGIVSESSSGKVLEVDLFFVHFAVI